MALPKRVFGRTGLEVTQLGYGAMEVRGERIWGGRPTSNEEAKSILNAVLDAGINFIDTANDYGKSELYIGRHIRHRKDEYTIATKCGCHMEYAGDHDETPHIWTRENILRNVADSLLKMELDTLDVLQLHGATVQECEENGLYDLFKQLKEWGAVRFIGCSSVAPNLVEHIKTGVFDVFQIPYSALERRHENQITMAAEAGAGIIIRGGVARGEPGVGLGYTDRWSLFEKAKLDELMEPGESRTSFLLRFTITHPHCHTTIVGTSNHHHLAENLATIAKGPLPADVYNETKRRLDEAGAEMPL